VRYEVSLGAGGQLSVVRQNSAEPHELADGRVRLSWRQEHNFRVPEPATKQ
jgi:putative spermidine/putrescine transport system ATP-binding protein